MRSCRNNLPVSDHPHRPHPTTTAINTATRRTRTDAHAHEMECSWVNTAGLQCQLTDPSSATERMVDGEYMQWLTSE
jgi:hypothetical protein